MSWWWTADNVTVMQMANGVAMSRRAVILWPSYFALLHGQMEVRYYCWPVRAITRQRRQVTAWRLPLYHHRSCFSRHNQHHSRRPRTSLGEISAEWPPFDQIALGQTASVALLRQPHSTVCSLPKHSNCIVQYWSDSLICCRLHRSESILLESVAFLRKLTWVWSLLSRSCKLIEDTTHN